MFDAEGLGLSPRLVVTGFSAFPGAPDNPSERVVNALAREGFAPEGAAVRYLTLPVVWTGAVERLREAIDRRQAHAVVLFGLAAEASCVRVETVARNAANPERADQQGFFWPGRRLAPAGPDARAATLPAAPLLSAIAATGAPCAPSDDAGDYICNRTLWGVLADGAARAIFVHLPLPQELARAQGAPCPSGLTSADLKAAARAAVTAAASVVRAAHAPAAPA